MGTTNTNAAAVAVLAANSKSACVCLPKKATLANLAERLEANGHAYDALMDSDAVSEGFKTNIAKRVSMRKVGRIMTSLARQLEALVSDTDEHKKKAFAFEVIRALPKPRMLDGTDCLRLTEYEPMTQADLRSALSRLHGSYVVDDAIESASKLACRAHIAEGVFWDMVWAMYACAASDHLPFVTMRQTSDAARDEMRVLGGPHAYVGDSDDDSSDINVCLSRPGLR